MDENNNTQQNTVLPTENAPIINPPPLMDEKNPKKRKLLILSGVVVLIILCISIVLLMLTSSKNNQASKTIQPSPTPVQRSEKVVTAPPFKARTFTYTGNLPTTPSLSKYVIKSLYTQEDIASFAALLNLEKVSAPDSNGLVYASSESTQTKGLLSFNPSTGTFSYKSYGNFTPSTYNNNTPSVEASELLEYLGILDPTVSCNVTYQKSSTPGVTYVECHRMWDKLNAPLLNLGGVVNIPENIYISSLTPGKTTSNTSPRDPSIINVSNGGNGLARPNEFNTITVGIFPDGRIHSIDSTMRQIKETSALNPSDMISAQEALEYFKQNKGQFSLTIPAGYGATDWSKVYPNNQARTEIAAISEITPAFIDKPLSESQEVYEPFYLIRGTARLESGYTVKFTQAIPALKDKLATTLQSVANDGSLQLQTFTQPPNPDISNPAITLPPTTPLPTQPPVFTACKIIDLNKGYAFDLKVPGYGNLSVVTATRGSKNDTYRTYFFATNRPFAPSAEFNAIRNAFFKAVEEQYVIRAARILTGRNSVTGYPLVRPDIRKESITERIQDMIVNTGGGPKEACTQNALETGNNEPCFQQDLAQDIANKVKARIASIQNNNALLESTATKENLFPERTLGEMHWLFIFSPVKGSVDNLPSDYVAKENERLECYISGSSPHIFIHSVQKQRISVKTGAKVTYADPKLENKEWTGSILNGTYINSDGQTRSSVYYEYDSHTVAFSEPHDGYIIKREELDSLIKLLSTKFGLTKNEHSALLSDAKREASNFVNTPYLKISLIKESELEEQLPLTIHPMPVSTKRIHLFISARNTYESIHEPAINTIQRSNYSVLELGAYAKNY